ncbi:MAG: hypothetical protein KJN73_07040 [Acidimicrobiia bacterium]|nr:hypothetical protein [Acidimicrobiia bacterium]MBT8247553.1 hypothetical protein [Acidimicrobiia bacterium]NNJ46305.1 hypothetical protein [Acidimicrobiia bacterium]RZV43232.1 MAG: hypothetical protein EX267_08550 [Acidimicrobiia bacterium]
MKKELLIQLIRDGFSRTGHPGDGFLQGSREGDDAFKAVQPFRGTTDWSEVDPAVLDEHSDALSFLSEGGFRFFLPAYLIADVNDELNTADVVFHLAGGFHNAVVRVPIGDQVVEKQAGRAAFVNSRRYGAMTFEDYARFRLSVFTREEARAIVAYLEHRRSLPDAVDRDHIDAALDLFWRERAEEAPNHDQLEEHVEAEEQFLRDVSGEVD